MWLVFHQRSSPDRATVLHHVLFIAITHFVLAGWYFKAPFAWLSLAELSTLFLNGRWFLAASGNKGASYLAASLAFAVTFVAVRLVGYSAGLAHLWAHRDAWWPAGAGLHAVVVGLHAGFALNAVWARSVVGALLRAVRRGPVGRATHAGKSE